MAIELTPEEKVLRQGAKRASESGNQRLMETYSNQLDQSISNRGGFDESSSVADASTPQDVTPTQDPAGFDVPVQQEIPSTTLQGNTTFDDVRAFRNNLEQQQNNAPDLSQFENIDAQASVFNDPDAFIQSALYGDREPTQAAQSAADIRSGITQDVGQIEDQLTDTTQRAEETTQLSEREQLLAGTNNDIAARTTRFRRELREMEENTKRRGQDRASNQADVEKLTSDAKADLADLYIIQNAQQGNVDAARDYIKTAVDNRYRSIEIELQQKQAALNELIPTLEAEEKDRAMQLSIALGERERNLATEKEEATAKRELAMTAAQNGASQTTISAITNAASVDEALNAASPYIGLLERQAAARAASNAALTRRKTLIELAMAGDQSAIAELGTYGEHLNSIKGDQEAVQRELAYNNAQEKITLAQNIKANELGLNMNTGLVQSGTGAALSSVGLGATAGFAAGGPIGAAVGTAVGVAAGLYVLSQGKKAKEDFQADIKSLVAPAALQELVDQKEAGATFGALSNAELGLLLAASQELAGHVIINDNTGEVRMIGSPDAIQADLDKVINYYEQAQFKTNIAEVDSESSSQIDRILNNPQ